jgi:TRAP-type C4-dicarboxylate transport system permease small subunit
VLTFWGGELLLDGLDVPMAGTALPQSATFLPMTAGGALMVVFALARLRTGPAIAVEPETY